MDGWVLMLLLDGKRICCFLWCIGWCTLLMRYCAFIWLAERWWFTLLPIYEECMLLLVMFCYMLLMSYCAFIWLNHDVSVTWSTYVISHIVMVLCWCYLDSSIMGRESELMASGWGDDDSMLLLHILVLWFFYIDALHIGDILMLLERLHVLVHMLLVLLLFLVHFLLDGVRVGVIVVCVVKNVNI